MDYNIQWTQLCGARAAVPTAHCGVRRQPAAGRRLPFGRRHRCERWVEGARQARGGCWPCDARPAERVAREVSGGLMGRKSTQSCCAREVVRAARCGVRRSHLTTYWIYASNNISDIAEKQPGVLHAVHFFMHVEIAPIESLEIPTSLHISS